MGKIAKNIVPLPGYLLCKPYIPNSTFVSIKEEAGEPQTSEVVAVGDDYVDDNGNLRKSPVEVGDLIVHRYCQDTFTTEDREEIRPVAFYQVIAKYVDNV